MSQWQLAHMWTNYPLQANIVFSATFAAVTMLTFLALQQQHNIWSANGRTFKLLSLSTAMSIRVVYAVIPYEGFCRGYKYDQWLLTSTQLSTPTTRYTQSLNNTSCVMGTNFILLRITDITFLTLWTFRVNMPGTNPSLWWPS